MTIMCLYFCTAVYLQMYVSYCYKIAVLDYMSYLQILIGAVILALIFDFVFREFEANLALPLSALPFFLV